MRRTKISAIRWPRPVLIIALDMKNAASTSQTYLSAYPLRAFSIGTARNKATATTPSRTIALPVRGCTIEPTMVAMKTASSVHASRVTPSGGDINAITMPTPIVINHLKILSRFISVNLEVVGRRSNKKRTVPNPPLDLSTCQCRFLFAQVRFFDSWVLREFFRVPLHHDPSGLQDICTIGVM